MFTRRLRVYAALAASLCPGVCVWAQSGNISVLRIEVTSEAPVLFSGYTAVLQSVSSYRFSQTADVDSDGRIMYRDIPPGEYQFQIQDGRGATVLSQFMLVTDQMGPISVTLPKPQTARPPSGGVSLTELQHPPARKAVEAAQAAQRFSEAGDFARAAALLQKAIQISPDFAAAYTNLAAQHARMGMYRQAIGESARAMQIGGANARDLTNMAASQAGLGRLGDAVQSLRAALRTDPAFIPAHFVLGSLLARDPRTRAEAVMHLRQAAPTIPGARELLEELK